MVEPPGISIRVCSLPLYFLDQLHSFRQDCKGELLYVFERDEIEGVFRVQHGDCFAVSILLLGRSRKRINREEV